LSLYKWFWKPVQSKFAMFGLTDQHKRKRDQEALMRLAHHCGKWGMDQANFHQMRVDDPRWGNLLFKEKYSGICFPGRLGIFGDEAVSRWGPVNSRFAFLLDRRPENLPDGQIDAEYHCVTQRLPDGQLAYERSEDRNGKRYDFGLVRRYAVRDAGRPVIVLNFAGGSGLGTLAATIWAIDILKEGVLSDGSPIPVPPQIELNTSLEALVRTSANINNDDLWELDKVELVQLYAGRYVWSAESGRWSPLMCSQITLVYDGDTPVSVAMDGIRLPMRPTSEVFRLLVGVCRQAMEKNGNIDIPTLCRNRAIWNDKRVSEKAVRARLANLKHHYLHECLTNNGTNVALTAEVKVDRT
jgi:hypothetical protein